MNFKRTFAGIMAAVTVFSCASIAPADVADFFAATAITASAADKIVYIDDYTVSVNNIKYNFNTTTKTAMVVGTSGTVRDLVVPNQITLGSKGTFSVTAIYSKAFKNNTTIRTVDLSGASKLANIHEEAFSGATKLTSVKLGNNVTSISAKAFMGCTALSTFNTNGNNKLVRIFGDAFNGCTSLKSITLPHSLKEIIARAFSNTGLTSITIPNSVTNVGPYAFSDCKNLKTIKFEASGTNQAMTVCGYAFTNAVSLEEVRIERTNIDVYPTAFQGANPNVRMVGAGAIAYTKTLCKKLVDSWGLKYSSTASTAAQKKFFTDLAAKVNSYITYNYDMLDEGCAASVLSVREGTCGGFSRAYYNCCLAAGVPVDRILVGGDAHCHAWNYVKVSSKWYVIDATNSTDIFTSSQYTNFLNDNIGYSSYHNGSKFVVCIDDQTGASDARDYSNPNVKNFDQALREGTVNGIKISGSRA